MCKEVFTNMSDLSLHSKSVHEGVKPNLCTLCGSTFATKTSLRHHVEAIHEGIRVSEKEW